MLTSDYYGGVYDIRFMVGPGGIMLWAWIANGPSVWYGWELGKAMGDEKSSVAQRIHLFMKNTFNLNDLYNYTEFLNRVKGARLSRTINNRN